jgi:Uma2 family endonuclease
MTTGTIKFADVPPLMSGDNLSWEEFERRWSAAPEIKKAELIDGIVYMSPLSYPSGKMEDQLKYVFMTYALATAGTEGGGNITWRMGADAPQPDAFLRKHFEYGGKSNVEGLYLSGVPELAAEACLTTAAYDLHQKKELYQRAGVNEFLVAVLKERELRWHDLRDGVYVLRDNPADGVHRSMQFPGLWINTDALLQGRMQDVIETLHAGLSSQEHALFMQTLLRKK